MRMSVAAAVAACLFGTLSATEHAVAAIRQDTQISPQSLGSALEHFARHRNLQFIYATDEVDSLKTAGAHGNLTASEALTELLRGTGLTYQFLDDHTVTVQPEAAVTPTAPPPQTSESTQATPSGADASKRESLWTRLRLAQSDGASPTSAGTDEGKARLEEIVVSAQKRGDERLQEVPVPVSAISAAALISANQFRLEDYQARIPSLRVTPIAGFGQIVSIRGITTGGLGANPTVGIAVDDVPFGSSTGIGYGLVIPDIDPGDLRQVEVLRGPQGTLYGASSMGGLIKFVTVDPATDAVSGRIEVGTSHVRNADDLGYNLRAAVNLPLSDTIAVRASGFTRTDAGYIDNINTGVRGVNEQRVKGGRVSGLWRPSGQLSVKVSAMLQDFDADGGNDVDPLLGELKQSWLRGAGPNDGRIQSYNLAVNTRLGSVDVAALTGYNVRESETSLDVSAFFGDLAEPIYGVRGVKLISSSRTEKFTQELRLSGPLGERMDWLAGAFYTHERSPIVQTEFAVDPANGRELAAAYHSTFPSTYEEFAGFADLTFHLSERFDVQVGGRGGSIRQTFQQTTLNPLFNNGAPVVDVGPLARATASPFTYLLTPRFRMSSELMLYARFASGYRPGGTNGALCVTFNFPCQYDPDKTQNYELGIKGDLLEGALTLDASAYRIDWKNIQIFAVEPGSGQGYNTNGSAGKSEGLELSAEARPANGLTISAWGVWNRAELTEAFPASASAYGVPGLRLPYSSRFAGNLSIEQTFPLGGLTGFVGGTVNRVGPRLGGFGSVADPAHTRQELPGYVRTDLRAGVRSDTWSANVFVNNVSDQRGILIRGSDLFPPTTLYIQPRLIGLAVSKSLDGGGAQ